MEGSTGDDSRRGEGGSPPVRRTLLFPLFFFLIVLLAACQTPEVRTVRRDFAGVSLGAEFEAFRSIWRAEFTRTEDVYDSVYTVLREGLPAGMVEDLGVTTLIVTFRQGRLRKSKFVFSKDFNFYIGLLRKELGARPMIDPFGNYVWEDRVTKITFVPRAQDSSLEFRDKAAPPAAPTQKEIHSE
ncbi:hypothetical protein ACFL4G_10025 [Thermodesulfobacteriota bacterium]